MGKFIVMNEHYTEDRACVNETFHNTQIYRHVARVEDSRNRKIDVNSEMQIVS